MPAWFLRLSALIFAAPLARLFHQSPATGVVASQWKTAVITPMTNITAPASPTNLDHTGFVTCIRVLCRAEIYIPSITTTEHMLDFSDQFAFDRTHRLNDSRYCGAITHCVHSMLADNNFSVDFSNVFYTVRHASLTSMLACPAIPDYLQLGSELFRESRPLY